VHAWVGAAKAARRTRRAESLNMVTEVGAGRVDHFRGSKAIDVAGVDEP
jgi:hypothetical protein